jgi:hypothetical protein
MPWDNRYIPYVRWAKLLPVTWLVGRGLSVFNAAAMTTLVDRWSPKTHSFHLLCGEMIVTLEDVAMILALPIRGQALTYHVDTAGWHERVTAFLGRPPPPRPTTGRVMRLVCTSVGCSRSSASAPTTPTPRQCPTK